jgi:hypothetical protein
MSVKALTIALVIVLFIWAGMVIWGTIWPIR